MCTSSVFQDIPESKLSQIDGRVKLAICLCALFAVISSSHWEFAFIAGAFSLSLLVIAGVPGAMIWRRMRPILLVAGLVGVSQVFFFGSSVIYELKFSFLHLYLYNEGLAQGVLLGTRIIGGMSVMLLLTLSTEVQEWVGALAWYRVPLIIIEIMTLAYSSLFVLVDELDRLQKAQRMRLGYSTWWRSVKAVGSVGGILFTRVFDKSGRLWQAMVCRGYNGEIKVAQRARLSAQDYALGASCLVVILISRVALG